jgi:hypothetical protein
MDNVLYKKKMSRMEDVLFVLKAVSDDETRYFLGGIYYLPEKNRIVSSDGRRLHIADGIEFLTKFPADQLDSRGGIILKTAMVKGDLIYLGKIDGQFLNYEKIIPEYTEHFLVDGSRIDYGVSGIAYPIFERHYLVYMPYLEDLGKMSYDCYCNGDTKKALWLKNDSRQAIIMPLVHD